MKQICIPNNSLEYVRRTLPKLKGKKNKMKFYLKRCLFHIPSFIIVPQKMFPKDFYLQFWSETWPREISVSSCLWFDFSLSTWEFKTEGV